jgi:LuxR family maltose regulon positive regulatory protein
VRHAIPQPRARTIPRPRLLAALARWPELRLIQFVAPAGYGKTTLAAAWAHFLTALPAPQHPTVAWISLMNGASADQLLLLFIDALAPHLPAVRDLRNADGGIDFAAPLRVQALCREIAAADRPLVLALDDVHLLTDPAAHALLQQILDVAPPALHLVFLSRTAPPLQLSRLILDDALLTLDAHDLAFDHEEFLTFARESGLDAQSAEVLAALEQRSTGWVAGLKLLAYDLRYNLPSANTLSASAALDEFFASRVLASLPPDLQSFVESAATLPYMTAELMAAVTQRPAPDCAALLHALAVANAFLTVFIPSDGQPPSYRFHPLFHDFLRRRAALHSPDSDHSTEEIRTRAAGWLCDHDDVDAALAILGTDDGRRTTATRRGRSSVVRRPSSALDALSRAVRRAVLRHDHAAVKRWLQTIPSEWITAHAPLAVCAGWHAWAAGHSDFQNMLAPWQRAIDAVAALPDAPQFDELRAEAAILQALRHILLGEKEALTRVVEAAEHAPHDQHGLAAAYLHFLRAAFVDVAADLESRIERLQAAADICERIGFGHGAIEMLYTQILLKRRLGQFESAQASAAQTQAILVREGWRFSTYVPEIHFFRGEMYYQADQLPAARASLQLAAETGHADGPTPTAYEYIAQLLLQMCDAAESPDGRMTFDFNADAAAWAEVLRSPSMLNRCSTAWLRMARDFRAGHIEVCRQTFESLQLTPANLTEHDHDSVRFAVLTGAIFSGRTDDIITTKLAELRTFLENTRFDVMCLQVQTLQALHAHQCGDARRTRIHLQELLPDIERTGMVRLLLDLPPLHQPLAECEGPTARRLTAQLRTPASAPHDYGLTRQERTILASLTDGLDPKDIAAKLTLSVGTVRVHIHRIYRKLQVNSREEAVQVWRAGGVDSDSR